MLRFEHSIKRSLIMLLAILISVSMLTVYTGSFAYAEEGSGQTVEEPTDPTDPTDPVEPVDPEDPPEPELISIETAEVVLSSNYFIYTGSAITPDVKVTLDGKELEPGTDYTVSFSDNIGPGKATVTITGTGEYTGEATAQFSIIKSGWYQKDGSWYYINSNGEFMKNSWVKDSKGWCWLGADGKMKTSSWISDKGYWYYLDGDGHMAANKWQKDSSGWCWVGSDGKLKTDYWLKSSGYWYYLDKSGHMVRNKWEKDSVDWCWLGSDGRMVYNSWHYSNGYWYYLNGSGHMARNTWEKDSKGWCWLGSDGRMVKYQWVKSSGGWYFIKGDGHMASNEWIKHGGNWYWLYSNGRMVHGGWAKIKNCWYYFDSSGILFTDPYVFVSVSEQTLYYCSGGELVFSTPVVTGTRGRHDTPTGSFYLRAKATGIHLKGLEDDGVTEYDSYVQYWMPFLGGEWGLHDADWRWSFGGDIYTWNGSHGCVNMPPAAAKRLFGSISVGTLIRIQ
jgi:glucan-binding YG repeat protein